MVLVRQVLGISTKMVYKQGGVTDALFAVRLYGSRISVEC